MMSTTSRFSSPEDLRDGLEKSTMFRQPKKDIPTIADIPVQVDDTPTMSEITRAELDSKLNETNLKVELRLANFENTVRETLSAIRQDSSEARREMGELRGDIGTQLGQFRGEVAAVSGELKAVHVELGGLKNLKSTMVGTTLAVVLAIFAAAISIYLGVKNDNQMLVSNSIASFGVGRDIGTVQSSIAEQAKSLQALQAELSKQAEETQRILQKVSDQQNSAPSTQPNLNEATPSQ